MKRRTLVSALGTSIASIAGCLGQASLYSDPTATDTQLSTPRDGNRQVHVTSIGTVHEEAPFAPSIEVLRSDVTADQTARIEVEVTSTADEPVWNTAVRIPAFSNFITKQGPAGRRLMLLKADEQYVTTSSGCWRADLSETQINHAYTDVVTDIRYDPGDTVATQFDIYDHPENTGACLAPGEYPIEALYSVSDNANTDTEEWEYRWGFSLTVEES